MFFFFFRAWFCWPTRPVWHPAQKCLGLLVSSIPTQRHNHPLQHLPKLPAQCQRVRKQLWSHSFSTSTLSAVHYTGGSMHSGRLLFICWVSIHSHSPGPTRRCPSSKALLRHTHLCTHKLGTTASFQRRVGRLHCREEAHWCTGDPHCGRSAAQQDSYLPG